jgi:hypothetical protein
MAAGVREVSHPTTRRVVMRLDLDWRYSRANPVACKPSAALEKRPADLARVNTTAASGALLGLTSCRRLMPE